MFQSALVAILMFSSMAFGSGASSYTCEAEDTLFHRTGKMIVHLNSNKILFETAGNSEKIYDETTICGWTPSTGMSEISCPFDLQNEDHFLALGLGCYKGNDPNSNYITTGSLQIQNGTGSLFCYVHSHLSIRLSLSKCAVN